MKLTCISILLVVGLGWPVGLCGQGLEPDQEGCRDSTVLSRMTGCMIRECSSKDFDSIQLQVAFFESGEGEARWKKNLEGQTEVIRYECPEEVSGLQIVRNAETLLRKRGFTIVYSGNSPAETPVVTARKGNQWVEVLSGHTSWQNGYHQTSVLVKETEQAVVVTADELADSINRAGRVAVYGINFDAAKATIKAESTAALTQIAVMMKKYPEWKLRVEEHTDDVGNKAKNQLLSEQRAAAVAAWLARNGVDKLRLASVGFGASQPVADNASEMGRARNRRIELVKF